MDRFIVVENACRKAIDDILKSSMDRFIVYTINHEDKERYIFKIQYG